MNSNTFLIGPIKDGVRRDSKAWSQPNDSFDSITNAYQWRDRVVKRSGYTLLGNLANGTPVMGLKTKEGFGVDVQSLVAFDLTTAYFYNGTAFVVLPSPAMPVVWSGTDYQFFFTTNYAAAFWATNSKPGLHGVTVNGVTPAPGITTISTTVAHGFSTNQSVTLINLVGNPDLNGNTYVITVTSPTTFTIPFMTAGVYVGTNGMALNSQVSIAGRDGIRYYGQFLAGPGWANYNPPIDPNNALAGALLIFPYRGYLVFLNTEEGNDEGTFSYGNRARWTQIGTPYYSEPVPVFPSEQGVDPLTARDDLFGRGGFNDAPTNEVIVAAEFIRDILIVYFERSTWRLRFVNNKQNPFVWERINKDLGADCTFSAIPFDKGLMAIGNRGIVISDGNDVIRFDEKIPDEIFNIRQDNFGFNRVQGIRTFRTKLIYWTYPSSDNPTGIYPDKVLVFNYDTKNWSFFDDCFTTFGYYYPTGANTIWADLTNEWASTANTWDGGQSQIGYENIVAGNQQGFVFLLEKTNGENAPSLNISAITAGVFTSTNHNLPDLSWITLSGITTTTSNDGVSLNGRNFQIDNPDPMTNPNTFSLGEFKPIPAGNAVGTSYTYTVNYNGILAGSIQINIGTLVFTDPNLDGILVESGGLGSGTIDYPSGLINLTFLPAIVSTPVNIRVVSLDPMQGIVMVSTVNDSVNEGQIAKISGIDIQTKIFNFFQDLQRIRISKIDFYVTTAENGQFTCNLWADSGNDAINQPLSDNLFSNIVLTSTNPYQVGQGDETIFRLFSDATAQTIQLQLTYSDQQMAVTAITSADIELNAMMMFWRKGGRTV